MLCFKYQNLPDIANITMVHCHFLALLSYGLMLDVQQGESRLLANIMKSKEERFGDEAIKSYQICNRNKSTFLPLYKK